MVCRWGKILSDDGSYPESPPSWLNYSDHIWDCGANESVMGFLDLSWYSNGLRSGGMLGWNESILQEGCIWLIGSQIINCGKLKMLSLKYQVLISGMCKMLPYKGRRIFVDVIKLMILTWGDYPGLSRGPKSNCQCPYRKILWRHRHQSTLRKRICDDRGRNWKNTAICQATSRTAENHPKILSRDKEGSFLRNFRGSRAPLTP